MLWVRSSRVKAYRLSLDIYRRWHLPRLSFAIFVDWLVSGGVGDSHPTRENSDWQSNLLPRKWTRPKVIRNPTRLSISCYLFFRLIFPFTWSLSLIRIQYDSDRDREKMRKKDSQLDQGWISWDVKRIGSQLSLFSVNLQWCSIIGNKNPNQWFQRNFQIAMRYTVKDVGSLFSFFLSFFLFFAVRYDYLAIWNHIESKENRFFYWSWYWVSMSNWEAKKKHRHVSSIRQSAKNWKKTLTGRAHHQRRSWSSQHLARSCSA